MIERNPNQNSVVNDEVRNLDELGLEDLRAVWTTRWGRAPRLRSVALLRSLIAWCLQAEAYGDLGAETRRRLKSTAIPRGGVLPVGARLSREYHGVRHDVEIGHDNVLYRGRVFGSLSAVAEALQLVTNGQPERPVPVHLT